MLPSVMQTIIDLPDRIFALAELQAKEARLATTEWLAAVLMEVIASHEIHYLRKDVIDWSGELLS